jgi:exosome complex component RRP42
MSKIIIPNLQKEKIEEMLAEGKRMDGRGVSDFRDIKVELGISNSAESAVSVKIGKTHVYAGVKMGVVTPYPDSPDEGTFMTTAELGPMSSDKFDLGRPGIESIEMGRVIDRGIRESGFIDFKALCIEEGEKVWQVFLDIVAINDDGNLFDAAGLAALIALGRARLPAYDKEADKIEHEFTETPLPLKKEALSFNMTLHKVGDEIVVDPSYEEELISESRLSIAMGDNDGEPRITAMQKGKEGALTSEDMEKILNLVEVKFKDTFPLVKEHVWGK